MKYLKFACLTFFILCISGIKAQQNHFIYLQTENKQPFYVKLDKKIYSSTASGYVIVPKLKDGSYTLGIGFPKSEWPEQKVVCMIEDNDIGYLLKKFESKGWGLFNLQTMGVIMANDVNKVANVQVVNKTDAFSNMLSSVVNDSTIRQTEVASEQVKKIVSNENDTLIAGSFVSKDTVQNQVGNEISKDQSKLTAEKVTFVPVLTAGGKEAAPANEPVVFTKSTIRRSLFNSDTAGTEMVFIDESNGEKDTIRIFIPAEKKWVVAVEDKAKVIEKSAVEFAAEPIKHEEKTTVGHTVTANKVENNKTVENEETGILQTASQLQKPLEAVVQKSPMINSDCKRQASDEDFRKLRKKMAAEDNDDDMIGLAKKIFKAKCFTVEQVKNLSVLFLKDAGKYSFFDMAYPFVSDSHNYNTLLGQLSETYYINRFQSMIRH